MKIVQSKGQNSGREVISVKTNTDTDIKAADKEDADITLDVIIPVYKPDIKFRHLMERLKKQKDKPGRVILLQTVEEEMPGKELAPIVGEEFISYAMELEDSDFRIECVEIRKQDFDHGATRAYGASLSTADILMFMTQDAVPADSHLITKMKEAFTLENTAAAYGRQLPREEAGAIESYTRKFNYPEEDRIKTLSDLSELGVKTYFCSNVCAAYRRRVYEELGGFVTKTIFNEDMIMAAGIIKAGYSIAYVSGARVYHSHSYSYREQFQRNFDLAVSQTEYADVFSGVKSENEGKKLVLGTAVYLLKKGKLHLLPGLILESGFKYLGYKAGRNYKRFPAALIRKLSMNSGYFTNSKK